VTQFWRQDNQPGKSKQKRDDDAERNASDSFDRSVKELEEEWVKSPTDLSIPCVKVSTVDTNKQSLFISPPRSPSIDTTHITETLIDLTNETRSRLHEVENKLRVLWVAAQQVNAQQKVEVSIR
jgi:hypothetical protein